ncbi:MAG TPA: hypothetical protein VJT82_01265, partial [Pyrinomonadaceae bacterium]|nr:hypothetical protein [Pyrinomonadaceae bacterium]
MRQLKLKFSRRVRVALAVVSLGLALAVCPMLSPRAQRSRESNINVTGVSTHTSGKDAVVSITADAPLTRAQTWQDDEGFHVVVYKGQGAFKSGVPRGVKVRRVGESLELVVPVKPGGSVLVQPRFTNLDLVVSGGMRAGAETNSASQTARAAEREQKQREAAERAAQLSSKTRANSGNQATANSQAKQSVVAVSNNKTKAPITPLIAPPAALKFSTPNATQVATQNQANNVAAVSTAANVAPPASANAAAPA